MLQRKSAVISDGEAVILWQTIDPEVVAAFKAEGELIMAKSGPSATSVEQPCDVGTEFKDLKAGVKTQQKREQDTTNEILHAGLESYWKNWLIEMKRISAAEFVLPSSVFREKVYHVLSTVTYVMQNGYMTPAKSKQAFIDVGAHSTKPVSNPIFGFDNATVDFDLMLNGMYKNLTPETSHFIRLHTPELVRNIRTNGKLQIADYKRVGIYQRLISEGFTIIDRDENVIWQQHAQIMNHEDNIEEWTGYRRDRDPVAIANREVARKQSEKDRKLIAATELKEIVRLQRIAESARVKALRGEEKVAYDAKKASDKLEAKSKKDNKDAEKKRTIEDAKLRQEEARDVRVREN